MAYLELVKVLIPTGLRGLILAGMAAALMSNVSSVLNSASTLATMDFYKKLIRPQASEKELVRFGRLSGAVILIVSMLIGYYYSLQKQNTLYVQLQSIFFFLAPPFAVIFTVGLLWRRATAAAALWTIGLGFAFTAFLVFYAFPTYDWLRPYRTYQHPALLAWVFCMAGDDRRLAADQAAAARKGRRHHLEPAIRPAARRIAQALQRPERFPHLVARLRADHSGDLRLLPLVAVSVSGIAEFGLVVHSPDATHWAFFIGI